MIRDKHHRMNPLSNHSFAMKNRKYQFYIKFRCFLPNLPDDIELSSVGRTGS